MTMLILASAAILSTVCTTRLLQERRALSRLAEAVRAYLRTGVAPTQLIFVSPELRLIWRSLLLLGARNRAAEGSKHRYEEMIGVSASLTAAADEERAVADALLALLARQLAPTMKAGAVVVRRQEGRDLEVVASHSVPLHRVRNALLMCFDSLLEAPEDSWGYLGSDKAPCFNFTVFGVVLSLFVPLPERSGISGGVWVGLSGQGRGLSAGQLEAVQVLVRHAAASFFAAHRAQTRREQSEKERDFLLGLSHDLRTPGNRALLAVRDLLESCEPLQLPEHRERLQAIEQAILEQHQLLSIVFEHAKHERGLLAAERQPVDIEAISRAVAEGFKNEARRKNLDFEIEVAPYLVSFDPSHLRRIISNLLTNAFKYTATGAIVVKAAQKGNEVALAVSDTGIGVPLSERASLFEKFERGSSAQQQEGHGLGLALARALAQLNGAALSYRPGDSGGSIFTLTIPLSSGCAAPAVRAPRAVLVAEDDEALRKVYLRYLDGLAPIVLSAGTLEEAREELARAAPAVLITDYHLGGKCAASLLQSVRAAETKLLVITGDSLEAAALRKERVTVLEKPVERVAFIRTVQSLLVDEAPPQIDWRTAA